MPKNLSDLTDDELRAKIASLRQERSQLTRQKLMPEKVKKTIKANKEKTQKVNALDGAVEI